MNSKLNIITLFYLIMAVVYIQGGKLLENKIFFSMFVFFFLGPIQKDSSSESGDDDRCDSHEQYICGPTCIETCDYKPEICTADCRYGCFCKKGYVRQSNATDSRCIKKKDCDGIKTSVKCPENEEYTACGSACPISCSDLYYPKKDKICTLQCVSGCFCKKGYYRAKDGTCVEAEKCCQGENEQYTRCGSACVETCDYKPEICTKQCIEGCLCKCDYIRKDNTTNSACIKRDQC